VLLAQVQHAPRPAPARAALGIGADRLLLVEKVIAWCSTGFRKAQLGMVVAELLHQGRGIAVGFKQAIQYPADRQFQAEMDQGQLVEELVNGLKA
jgi:hypothetical protein